MIIEGDFYRIIPINDHAGFYDLELQYDIGGKNPRKEFKNVAYGLTFENALKSIVRFAINQKYKEEVINLNIFIDEYKKQMDKILKIIND